MGYIYPSIHRFCFVLYVLCAVLCIIGLCYNKVYYRISIVVKCILVQRLKYVIHDIFNCQLFFHYRHWLMSIKLQAIFLWKSKERVIPFSDNRIQLQNRDCLSEKRISHYKHNTVVRSSYRHTANSSTRVFFIWKWAQGVFSFMYQTNDWRVEFNRYIIVSAALDRSYRWSDYKHACNNNNSTMSLIRQFTL